MFITIDKLTDYQNREIIQVQLLTRHNDIIRMRHNCNCIMEERKYFAQTLVRL